MSAEIQNRIASVEEMLERIRDASRFEDCEKRLGELEERIADAGFWKEKETESSRKEVIEEFKKEGFHEVNGVPVEDFVINAGNKTVKHIYDTYVKPAGF